MMISVNGPNLEYAVSVTEAIMSKYCNCKKGPSGTLCEDDKHKTTLLHQKVTHNQNCHSCHDYRLIWYVTILTEFKK